MEGWAKWNEGELESGAVCKPTAGARPNGSLFQSHNFSFPLFRGESTFTRNSGCGPTVRVLFGSIRCRVPRRAAVSFLSGEQQTAFLPIEPDRNGIRENVIEPCVRLLMVWRCVIISFRGSEQRKISEIRYACLRAQGSGTCSVHISLNVSRRTRSENWIRPNFPSGRKKGLALLADRPSRVSLSRLVYVSEYLYQYVLRVTPRRRSRQSRCLRASARVSRKLACSAATDVFPGMASSCQAFGDLTKTCVCMNRRG